MMTFLRPIFALVAMLMLAIVTAVFPSVARAEREGPAPVSYPVHERHGPVAATSALRRALSRHGPPATSGAMQATNY